MSALPPNYYNDGRDVLEAAYPTSTSFTRYHSRPTLAGLERRTRGVAIVLALQSESALVRFRRACYQLEDSVPWDHFHFDAYDFAGIAELMPTLSAFGSITGSGELFWISGGAILDSMTTDYDPTRFDELTTKLINA